MRDAFKEYEECVDLAIDKLESGHEMTLQAMRKLTHLKRAINK